MEYRVSVGFYFVFLELVKVWIFVGRNLIRVCDLVNGEWCVSWILKFIFIFSWISWYKNNLFNRI